MAHPAFVNINSFFYPVGNTPAVCLTQDLPPNQDANLLLLGCGDLRNILHTVYSESKPGYRRLDFTCCDIEAAIIARNILLLTLLFDDPDGCRNGLIWCIAYHFYLGTDSAAPLKLQAHALLAAADSLKAWHASPYGKVVRICDQGTFSRVREVWKLYIIPEPETNGRSEYDARFETWIQSARTIQNQRLGQGFNTTGYRSAGPVGMQACEELPLLFRQYWKHGVTGKSTGTATIGNPTFLSSDSHAVALHYGTDPLLGYHLAIAYTPLTSSSVLRLPEKSKLARVVSTARAEFRQWSASLVQRVAAGKLTVRFFAGDALAFCHALKPQLTSPNGPTCSWYRSQYTVETIIFNVEDYATDARAPLKFHVIDTSNLTDHLGGINILTAASPLLEDSGTATLYMETLLKREKDAQTLADTLFGGHFPTICLLLGLVPAEYWSNATVTSTAEETLLDSVLKLSKQDDQPETQLYNRLVLRRLRPADSSCSRLCFEANDLAQLIFHLYLNLFRNESFSRLFSQFDLQTAQNSSILHYHRGSLAAFLTCVKSNVTVDWPQTMDVFLGLVETDSTLLMGMNYIQELYLFFHLYGLHTTDTLGSPLTGPRSHQGGGFTAWQNIPSSVCITLKVPRANLAPFFDISRELLGTPILQCTMQSSAKVSDRRWQNIFSAIHLVFGDVTMLGSKTDDHFKIKIQEDDSGWNGNRPLLVSFLAPSWTLLLEPSTTEVSLGVQSTPQSTIPFATRLGLEMNVYKTVLGNSDNVFVTKHPPNVGADSSLRAARNVDPLLSISNQEGNHTSLKAVMNSNQLVSLNGRVKISKEPTKSQLSKRAQVKTSQCDPCTVNVTIGTEKPIAMRFPVPVLLSRAKIKIARTSSYVEVVAPTADTRKGDGIVEFMHPFSLTANGPMAWNMPRLSLDLLPTVDISQKKDLKWLITHASLMWSSRERHLVEKSRQASNSLPGAARVDLKDSLFSLFMHFTGVQGQKARLFGINQPGGGGVHILIFVFSLRMDTSNRTVVLDTAILPLRESLMPELVPFLEKLPQGDMCPIKASEDEMKLWKKMIPAWVERCRDWEHVSTCAYQLHQKVPVSVEPGKETLCRCGDGKLPPKLKFNLARWDLVAKHAARAAISPTFSVPYVERSFEGKPVADTPEKSTEETAKPVNREEGCQACGKVQANTTSGALLRCTKCKNARYCSRVCQRQDWKTHKETCKEASQQ